MRRSKRSRPPSGAATCTTDGAGTIRRRELAALAATGRMIFSGDFRRRFTALAGRAEMVPLCRCKGCSICVRFFGPVRRAFRSCAAEDVASLTGRNDRPFGAGRGRMRALFPGAGRPFDPMIPARTIAAGLGGRSAGGRRDASERRRTAGAAAAGAFPAFVCLRGAFRRSGERRATFFTASGV